MSDREYVREYFSARAREWMAAAYGDVEHPPTYPVGMERVRLALEAALERLGSPRGRLVDLGCGGGELCAHAATLGFAVIGIDSAEGMVAEAEARRMSLPPDVQKRLALAQADIFANGLPAGGADAVTAIGLLEYLDDDHAFLTEAARLLRPGGVLVISCRNRLFNMASLNDYTRQEVSAGTAAELLDEIAALPRGRELRAGLTELAKKLRQALDGIEEALALDERDAEARGESAIGPGFGQPRRQHTPRQLATAAVAAGFGRPAFQAIHPHFMPLAIQAAAPRVHTRLSQALEALEVVPASLAWSSAFLGVFTR